MKKLILIVGALTLCGGLIAYGVSPSQSEKGKAADQIQPTSQLSQPSPLQPQSYDQMAVPDWAKAWKHHDWAAAKAMYDAKTALFIDARAKVEYDQGHIPGAIPMPLGEFDAYFEKYKVQIKKAKNLVPYCHGVGCQLSNKVAQKLYNDKGFRNVGSFFGGWPQWQQHNMPVETGPGPK